MSAFVKFAHGCIKTPLDKKSHLPKPLYERQESDERNEQTDEDGDDDGNKENVFLDDEEKSLDEEDEDHIEELSWQEEEEGDQLEDGGEQVQVEEANIDYGENEVFKGNLPDDLLVNQYDPEAYAECQCQEQNMEFYDRLQFLKHENLLRLHDLRSRASEPDDLVEDAQWAYSPVSEDVYQLETPPLHSHFYHCRGSDCDCDCHDRDCGVRRKRYSSETPLEGNGMFEGVGTDSEDNEYELRVKVGVTATTKRRRRGRSAEPSSRKPPKTVSKPFRMTIREEEKRRERQLMLDLIRTRESREAASEDEAAAQEDYQPRFRAKAVPDHVREPVLLRMIEAQPQRFNARSRAYLTRVRSAPDVRKEDPSKVRPLPFPAHIFTNTAYERMRENDAYRKMQREVRMEQLARKAKMPPRMQKSIEEREVKQKLKKNMEKRQKRQGEKISSHAGHRSVPDFERLYENFRATMERKKGDRVTTVAEPFSFDQRRRSSSVSKERPKSAAPIVSLPSKPRPRSSLLFSSFMSPETSARSRTNTASDLRTQANRARAAAYDRRDSQAHRRQLELELRQRELRHANPAWAQVREEVGDSGLIEERLRDRQETERERARDYKMELDKMQARVQMRPTLFQRQSKLNAKQNAEKKYHEVLKQEGLDEEELVRLIKPKPGKKRKVRSFRPQGKSRHGSGSLLETQASVMSSRIMTRTNSVSLGSEYEVSSMHDFDY